MNYKFQFVGMGRQPIRYALHPTNNCPAPLDSELRYKFQFIRLLSALKKSTSLRASSQTGVAIPFDFRHTPLI